MCGHCSTPYTTSPERPPNRRRSSSGVMAPAWHRSYRTCRQLWSFLCQLNLGDKSGDTPTSKTDSQQQGFLGDTLGPKWPLSCGFVLRRALRRPRIVARFQARNREFQAFDLRFYGAPKGIRIPVAALKGRSPWPLDDGGVFTLVGRAGLEPATLGLKVPCSAS